MQAVQISPLPPLRRSMTGFRVFDRPASLSSEASSVGQLPTEPKARWKHLAGAVLFLGSGLLLHRLPARVPGDGLKTIMPADWKVWARVILGIVAVQKLNKGMDWHLPPWLGALQAVAIINPLAVGLSKNSIKQTLVMAPVVAGVVQGASEIQKKLAPPLEEKWDIPPVLTRLGLSLGLGVLAMLAYPRLYRGIASTGIIGGELKEQAVRGGSAFATAAFASCARGCSPGSFVCLGEMADIVGSFSTWFRNHKPDDVPEAAKPSAPKLPRPQPAASRFLGSPKPPVPQTGINA